MPRLVLLALLLSLTSISLFALSMAQDVDPASVEQSQSEAEKLAIVPLVIVKPGETKELTLSTWCTVGATRGGGFGLTEMRDGKPTGSGHDVKSYSRVGVNISVPDFKQGTEFASSPEFAALKKLDIDAFKVTVSASRDAKPGLLEMHLVDSTCSGHCKTDFRVLVVAR